MKKNIPNKIREKKSINFKIQIEDLKNLEI